MASKASGRAAAGLQNTGKRPSETVRHTLPADDSLLYEPDGIVRALLRALLNILPEALVVPDVIRAN